jgi:16S rRNA (uracil1498-N3)-methyltransferase
VAALPVDSAAHVFVADLEQPDLDEDDRHHLARVLRLRAGEAVSASDGQGRWRPCRFTGEGPAGLEVVGPVVEVAPPAPPLTVGFALVKGDRPELIVQKLTELGIDRIAPFVADRTVVRWDDGRATRNLERLRKVARAAAMQSRQVRLPAVLEVRSLRAFYDEERGSMALAQRGGRPPSLRWPTVLIGPEGGWSPAELALGNPIVSFSDSVLRAETASITVGGVLAALRSGLIDVVG